MAADAGQRAQNERAYEEFYDDATEMLRNTEKVPLIIFCCIDLNKSSKTEEVRYASIFPAAQNLMLAAHAIGREPV